MSYEKLTSSSPESQSESPVADHVNALASLFPSVVREGKVDFDALRQMLGDDVAKDDELFGLQWKGKAQARRAATTPSLGTLRPCKEESVDWETTKNLYIEGDNLEVLKLLRKSYAGKVKMIYIDPPYNSRQYSRFYHVLENITCWRKPELHGVALKPDPENMSDYCRNKAKIVFKELIDSLDCKYIVVSYNNTYESKSSSSKNKMTLEDIETALSARGEVQRFETSHNFFNAGKTDFNDHKELIFIVKVK